MTTEFGEIKTKVTLDTAPFDAEMQRAVAAGTKLGGMIGTAVADAILKAGELVGRYAEAQAATGDLAQKLGLTTEAASKLAVAARISGTDLDSVSKAMSGLSQNAVSAAGGSKESAAAFAAIGVSVTQASGAVKSGDQLLGEVADKFATYRDGAEKSALAAKLFGDAGTSLIPLLNGGSAALDDYSAKAEQFGMVVSGPAAQASSRLNEALNTLQMAGEGVVNTFMSRIMPVFADYAELVVDLVQRSGVLAGAADVLTTSFKYVGIVVVGVKNVFEAAFSVLYGVNETFGAAAEILSGFGKAVGPGLEAAIAKVTGDTQQFAESSKAAGEALTEGWSKGTKRFEAGWSDTEKGVKESFNDFVNFADAIDKPIIKISDALQKKLAPSLEAVKVAFASFSKAEGPRAFFKAAVDTANAIGAAYGKFNEPAPTVDKPKPAASAVPSAEDKDKEKAASWQKLVDMANALAGALGPLAAAQAKEKKTLDDLNAASADAVKKGNDHAAVEALREQAAKNAALALDNEKKKLDEQGDVLGRYLNELDKSRALDGLTDRQKAVATAVQAATKEFEANGKASVTNKQTIEELTAAVADAAGKRYDEVKAIEAATAAAKRHEEIIRGALGGMVDAFANWAVNGFSKARDFWKGMVDLVKRAVAQIIAEWLKTRIIGAFFGGSVGSIGAAVAASAGSSGGGSVVNAVVGTAAKVVQPGGFNYSSNGSIFSAQSWIDAGKNLWSGFKQLWYGTPTPAGVAPYADPGLGGYGPGVSDWGTVPDYANGAPGAHGMRPTYQMSMFDKILGIAGGAYAGYNRYQNSNGGMPGMLGAAAYGLGTLGMTGVVGSMMGGFGAGVGMTSAMGAVGLGAVPVIGWIALVAMIVDMVAGGKLFGTKFRPESSDARLSVNAEGGESSIHLTEVRQRSLFRGRQWRGTDLPGTPEMQEAAEKFWKSLEDINKKVAKATGQEIAPVIDASLSTITEYDKKGRVTATKYMVEAIGRSWEEASEELALKRISAEQMIAALDFGQLQKEANAIAERYRKDAEALSDAAATMVQARADLKDGKGLLGAGDTLTSTMDWVEKQREGGETLAATYARLSQATQQYNAIVEQTTTALDQLRVGAGPVEQMRAALEAINKQMDATIKALNDAAIAAGLTAANEKDLAQVRALADEQIAKLAKDFQTGLDDQLKALTHISTPAGDFAATMRAISQSLRDNIAQANMLARAQGMAGASTRQLAQIHELAARQAAAAVSRLMDVGRNQVRSLYGGAFTLDQVNTDIAELQGRANAAAGAVQDFGGAISDTANAAAEAMNLLLGNLSPLNDAEKLQQALGGLAAGTVSQEQVLEIGRRLYASSAQYTALFNQVTSSGRGTAAAAGGGGGGGGASAPQGLTAEEQQRLQDLLLQRDELAKQQRINEARELANTVATLAAAKDESFEEVAKQLGLDLAKLAKDLGIGSQEELLEYLGDIDVSQDAVTDSFTSNTDRIIATMEKFWGDGSRPLGGTDKDYGRAETADVDLRTEVRRGTDTYERIGRDNALRLEQIDGSLRELSRNFREAFAMPRSTRLER